MPDIRVKVGVVGSAAGEVSPAIAQKAFALGRAVAGHNCVVLTGACPGYPHEAVLGAKSVGGLVIGISPALSLQEHIDRYLSPWEEYDVIVYTGSGLMGREIELIRSCDIVSVVAGRSGTLGEFAIAYDEAKLICVLEGSGGIADHLRDIVAMVKKETGADLIYDEDPEKLIERGLAAHAKRVAEGRAFTIPLHT
jgi:hypothetical protein